MVDYDALITLGGFIAVNFLAASSGAVFKPGAWYEGLAKPSWTPPNWAFPVVWSVLFLMNAVAGWLVWQAGAQAQIAIFALYGASLFVNAAWSAFFFGMRRMDLALIDVTILWLSIVAVIVSFATVSPLAAALLLPYLAWVSLAGVLNWRMVQLNPRTVEAV